MVLADYLTPGGGLDSYLRELEAKGEFSGTVLVGKDDEILFVGAYGLADRSKKIPMAVDTKLNLGSVNKSFTAVAVCQLIQEGKLSVNDTVETFLPEFGEISEGRITIERLLTHTAGLGNYMEEEGYRQNVNKIVSVGDTLPYCKRLAYEPGERYSYSNAGYTVLGAVIEAVSGRDYFDYIDEYIYKAAGMVDSGSYYRDEDVPNMAIGYVRASAQGGAPMMIMGGSVDRTIEPIPNTPMMPLRGNPAGGGYSTVEDLFRFIRAVENGVILKDGFDALVPDGSRDYNYGVGHLNPAAREAIGHNGGAPGISVYYEFYRNLGYTFAVQCNLDSSTTALSAMRKNLIPDTVEPMPPTLEVNGKVVPGATPIVKDGVVYVPVEALCRELGLMAAPEPLRYGVVKISEAPRMMIRKRD